ncbi:uncharacterized protein [Ptychodera flava]|uniref:uncharacterized protein n=1 Tax=Ptychodera flava TaxID=63121 RepID=UPI00396A9DF3
MVSGALIVSEKWGPLTDGDVTSAVRLLTHQMRIIGLEAHCTAIKVNSMEQEEANQLGVTLHLPNPVGRLRLREPHPDWLLMHNLYFPNLGGQENIKVIFGFGMTTCDAAVKIRKDLYPQAKLYIVNLWPTDSLKPSYLRCGREEFISRAEHTFRDCFEANAVISIGFNTYMYHCRQYQGSDEIVSKHFQVPPLPDDRYFSLSRPDFEPEIESYQVLSLFEDHYIRETQVVTSFADVVFALKSQTNTPMTWRMVGVPSGLEKQLKEYLTPEQQEVFETTPPLPMEALDEEMKNANLIFVPKAAVNSRSLALNSMAYGVPCMVPAESDIHVILNQHMRNIEKFMVDEMTDLASVRNKIRDYIQRSYNPRYRASEVRRFLHNSAHQTKQDMKKGFQRLIRPDRLLGIRLTRTEAASLSIKLKDPFSNRFFRYKLKAIRKPYETTVHLSIKSGIPAPRKGMDKVDDDLFGQDRPEFQKCLERLAGVHGKMKAKYFDRLTTRFIMEATTIEALDALWKAYEEKKLCEIMDEILLTYDIMEEIGAMYLKLEVSLDMQEYEQCRKELMFEKVSRWKFERRRSTSDMDKVVIPRDDRYRWYYREDEKKKLQSSRSLTDVYLMSAKRNARLAQLTFEEELEMMKHPIPDKEHNVYNMIRQKLIEDNQRLHRELRELRQTEKELEEKGREIDIEIEEIKKNIDKQRAEHKKKETKLRKEIAELKKEKEEYERLEQENARLQEEVEIRTREIKEMEESNEDRQKQIDDLRARLKQKSEELEREFQERASQQHEPPMQE